MLETSSKSMPDPELLPTVANYSALENLEEADDYGKKIPLSSLKLVKDLGSVRAKDSQLILQKFADKNPELDIENFEIVANSLSNTSALLAAKKGGNYSGKVDLSYVVKEISLTKDLTKTKLGFLPLNEKSYIKNRLISLNPNLETKQVIFDNITENTAIVKPKEGNTVYDPNS